MDNVYPSQTFTTKPPVRPGPPGLFPASTTPPGTLLPPPVLAPPSPPGGGSPQGAQPVAQAVQPAPDALAQRAGQLQQELGSMRSPAPPQLADVPAPPKYEQTDPFSGIAPVMMVLAGLASYKTKKPATTMLRSFAEFNKARTAGDLDRLKAAHDAWKDSAQQVVDMNKARTDEFKAAVEGNKDDQRAIQAELTALYTQDKDYAMLQKLNTDGGYKTAQEQNMALTQATAQLANAIKATSAGLGVGADGKVQFGVNAVTPGANPHLPDNEYHIETKDPVGDTALRPADRARANLKISTDNSKALTTYQAAADATNVQDEELNRYQSLIKNLPPAYFNRPLTSLAGSGYSTVLDEANKINIKQSLASAPSSAGRNLGVKMEQLLQQASPGPNITAGASMNLIALQKAINANIRDSSEFVDAYTQPQTDSKGRAYNPKATDAKAAWQDYLDHAGDRVDVTGDKVVANPKYVPWKEYFPIQAAAKASKIDVDKALDFYRTMKAKGAPLQDIVDALANHGGK